jgi:hypothetical protein
MENRNPSTVVGVFERQSDVNGALDDLYRAGFKDDQIGVVAHGEGRTTTTDAGRPGTTEDRAEGAVSGAVTGGALGAVLGAAAALAIPGVGPVLAGGILASALGGAAIGAAAGGILGALTDMGVPEEDARYYETEFRGGRTLLTVRATGRADEARNILQRHGAYDVSSRTARRMA